MTDTNIIRQFGKAYIERGFSIIPLRKNKRPYVKWEDYQTRRATAEELEGWISQYPDMQLGIVTGKLSGIVVVDTDDYKDGFLMDIELPKTTTVQTGSGGKHLYYRYPKDVEVRNAADALHKWDIRAEGGYVVAPPSFNEKGQYVFLGKTTMAELPQSIVELARQKNEAKKAKQHTPAVRDFGGTIFDQLAAYDCRMGLEMLSGNSCVNGEVYSFTNRSGGGYHIQINGNDANCWIDERGMIGSGTAGRNGRNASPTLGQWLQWYGHDNAQIAKIIKDVFGFKDMPLKFEKSKSKNSYTWGLDGIDEMISPLKKQTLTILCADENAGKSTFSHFFARQNAKKYGHKVVLYSLESTVEELHQSIAFSYAEVTRIQERDESYLSNPRYCKKIEELQDEKDITIIGRTAGKMTDMAEIEATLARHGEVDLLILDNLTCIELSNGKYNENEAIKEIIMRLIDLSRKLDCPIVLVHHFRKRAYGKRSELYRGIHELSGSRVIKDLAHKVIQVARKRGEEVTSEIDRAEFYIREEKVRNRGGDNEFMVYFRHGEFQEMLY